MRGITKYDKNFVIEAIRLGMVMPCLMNYIWRYNRSWKAWYHHIAKSITRTIIKNNVEIKCILSFIVNWDGGRTMSKNGLQNTIYSYLILYKNGITVEDVVIFRDIFKNGIYVICCFLYQNFFAGLSQSLCKPLNWCKM